MENLRNKKDYFYGVNVFYASKLTCSDERSVCNKLIASIDERHAQIDEGTTENCVNGCHLQYICFPCCSLRLKRITTLVDYISNISFIYKMLHFCEVKKVFSPISCLLLDFDPNVLTISI